MAGRARRNEPGPIDLHRRDRGIDQACPALRQMPSGRASRHGIATLRGLLRWWWRTLHAGHVDAPTLRALETAIWGSTRRGGAVRISLTPGLKSVQQYDFKYYYFENGELKGGFQPTEQARQQHDLVAAPNDKTTQGLFYLSYGMDDGTRVNGRRTRKQRHVVGARSYWTLRVQVRRSVYVPPPVSADDDRRETTLSEADVRAQAQAALWLLIHYGGVGSKGRKGFGSFADQEIAGISSIADCQTVARALREACGLGTLDPCEGPALPEEPDILPDIITPWKDPWFVLDRLGFAVQSFAQRYAHDRQKSAFGLPRKIHGPKDTGPMNNQTSWQPPVWLGSGHRFRCNRSAEKMRDASPLHFHVARAENGHLIVRGISLRSTALDALGGGPTLRRECLVHVRDRLEADIEDFGPTKGQRAPAAPRTTPTLVSKPLLPVGEMVQVTLKPPKKAGKAWKAIHLESGREGAINNWSKIPPEMLKEGEVMVLRVHFCNARDMAFEYMGSGE